MTDPRAAPPPFAARAEQVRASRQKVLDAARELFLRRGYFGATIEAIAQRARVSPQTSTTWWAARRRCSSPCTT